MNKKLRIYLFIKIKKKTISEINNIKNVEKKYFNKS